jgi:glutathione S-transferase
MRLYTAPASPFVRKCRIVVREKGLTSSVEEVDVDVYAGSDDLLAANPIGQIPALVTDDGLAITNSPLICAWLDAYSGRPRLLPEGEGHWPVRRMETLADGILELAVKLVLEGRRPEGERSPTWIARWTAGIERALDVAEQKAPDPVDGGGAVDLGMISLGIVGPYLDFRQPHIDWRSGRPRLVALTDSLAKRPSFAATAPR